MVVAIDDSGDPGFKFSRGSSKYFCIVVVWFTGREEAERTREAVNILKKKLHWSQRKEFKFYLTGRGEKAEFFKWLRREEIDFSAVMIDKKAIAAMKPDLLYNSAILEAINRIKIDKDTVEIIIDGEKGKSYSRNVKTFFRKNMPGIRIKSLKYCNSKEDNLIQIADMVAGALRRERETGKAEFIDLLSKEQRKALRRKS